MFQLSNKPGIVIVLLWIILLSCNPSSRGYKIFHITEYNYSKPVSLSDQIIRLHSFKNDERIISCDLMSDSVNYVINNTLDKYNQQTWSVHFEAKVNHFKILTRLVLDTAKLFGHDYRYSLSSYKEPPRSFLKVDSIDSSMHAFLKSHPLNHMANEQDLLQACGNVFQQFAYEEREEPGVYTTAELLKSGVGSCRDMTWFLVQYLRSQQIQARVVSGYLINWDEKIVQFHAWAEAKSYQGKWLGLDPTSGQFITAFHIPLSIGENYNEVLPLEGFSEPCEVKLDFEMKLTKQ